MVELEPRTGTATSAYCCPSLWTVPRARLPLSAERSATLSLSIAEESDAGAPCRESSCVVSSGDCGDSTSRTTTRAPVSADASSTKSCATG